MPTHVWYVNGYPRNVELLSAALDALIGDTRWDVLAAAGCGIRTVAVLSGGIAEAELREAGAIAVYADVAALLDDANSPLLR